MTLGNVYDLDLKRNETVIRDVIIQAQGEMALEEYLKQVCVSFNLLSTTRKFTAVQVRETWTSFTLDLVNYQNKCRLIR